MARNYTSDTDRITNATFTIGTVGTISIRVNPNWTSGDSVAHCIWWIGDASSKVGFQQWSSNAIYCGFETPSDTRLQIGLKAGLFVKDEWANWVYSWSSGVSQALYKDTSLIGSGGTPTVSGAYPGYTVGNYASGVLNKSCRAILADFVYWPVILTAEERAALASGMRPNHVRSNGLWLPLDGLQSPEPEFSGNAKNGTVSGPTLSAGPPVTMFTPRWPRNYDVPATTIPLSQTHFRFRTDTGAVDAAPTWGNAEDAA